MGVIEGMNFGRWDTRIAIALEAKNHPPKGVTSKVMENWAIKFGGKDVLKKKAPGITATQIISGITKIYADYRNQQIPIVSLVDVVIESIKGASKEEVENRLMEMRKEIANGSLE